MKTLEGGASMETLLGLEEARRVVEEAIEKLEEKFTVERTGYKSYGEEEEIVGEEIILHLCGEKFIGLQLGGWVEVDRRTEEPYVWFNGIVIVELPNGEEIKFGGGYENYYRVIKAEYNVKTGEWDEFYVDSL